MAGERIQALYLPNVPEIIKTRRVTEIPTKQPTCYLAKILLFYST
jgi:hypothetical protein